EAERSAGFGNFSSCLAPQHLGNRPHLSPGRRSNSSDQEREPCVAKGVSRLTAMNRGRRTPSFRAAEHRLPACSGALVLLLAPPTGPAGELKLVRELEVYDGICLCIHRGADQGNWVHEQ